jgi:hypothetical protein
MERLYSWGCGAFPISVFVQYSSATPYRKLKFTTESIVLESLNTRASGQLRQNKKDLKDKNTTPQMIEAINQGIERDELMLGMIKKYKESTKEPQQQNLF